MCTSRCRDSLGGAGEALVVPSMFFMFDNEQEINEGCADSTSLDLLEVVRGSTKQRVLSIPTAAKLYLLF